ncbi:MAG: SseB family protein [Silicimonas sp.]|nr:SseB family protein [Silicimonas sp.]
MTPLDRAHAAMEDAPDDDSLRLDFFERIADAELFLLLESEPQGDAIKPALFDTSDGRFVLAFDREERLTSFTERPAPYVALAGRAIAAMLSGQDTGLGLNLGVAPSSFLVPVEALEWLANLLQPNPQETEARPEIISAPAGLPERLVAGIDTKLASATGLARMAWLVGVTYPGGVPGHLLAFIDTEPGAESALARAISEALVFSGIEGGLLDVAHFRASDPIAARLARHGLRFDLPQPKTAKPPGMDPSKPPRLR